MPIVISVYNHKGGVCKTTTALNLAYVLGERLGKKILIADLDPQANATAFVQYPELKKAERKGNYEYQKDYYEKCEQDAANPDATKRQYRTMRDALRPSLHPVKPRVINVDEVAPLVRPEMVADYNNVDILTGHLDIGNLDSPMTLGSSGVGGMQQFPPQVNNLLRRVRNRDGNLYDIIILDLGPGTGGLNQCLIMGSDYICAPYAPEYFSQVAVRNLGDLLCIWNKHFEKKELWDDFDGKQDSKRGPVFLGAFAQRVRVKYPKDRQKQIKSDSNSKDKKGRIIQAHEGWMLRILDEVIILAEKLKPLGMVFASFPKSEAFGGIQDLASLAQDIMHSGRPIVDRLFEHYHTDSKGKKRKLHGYQKYQKNTAAQAYNRLVGVLMNGLSEPDKNTLGPEFVRRCLFFSGLSDGIDFSKFAIGAINKRLAEREKRKGSLRLGDNGGKNKNKKITFESFQDEWYESQDLDALFTRYLDGRQGENIHCMAALGDLDKKDTFIDSLKARLDFILKEAQDNNVDAMQYLFLPLNLGNRHWVLLSIGFSINSTEVEAGYYDPMGEHASTQLSAKIYRALSEAFPGNAAGNAPHWRLEEGGNAGDVIQSLGNRVQYDDFNCGPWVVETAVELSAGRPLPMADYDIDAARKKHWDDALNARHNPPSAARRKSKSKGAQSPDEVTSSSASSSDRKRKAQGGGAEAVTAVVAQPLSSSSSSAVAVVAIPAPPRARSGSAALFDADSSSRRDSHPAKDPRYRK